MDESDVDAGLKALWDAFTRQVVPDSNVAQPRLRIQYVKLI